MKSSKMFYSSGFSFFLSLILLQAVSAANLSVSGGMNHTAAIRDDGTVWVWGDNSKGQFGSGVNEPASGNTPVKVPGIEDVTALAAGGEFVIALKADGTVWGWGGNYAGQLGNGTVAETSPPVQTSGISDMTAVAAGLYHSLALKSDGTVSAWGFNGSGQLGNGTAAESASLPTTVSQVSGFENIIAVAAGAEHSVALKDNGTVWTWGKNDKGQLGKEGIALSKEPVWVSGISDVKFIAAGAYHTIALTNNGTLWAWGWNEYKQLGISTEPVNFSSKPEALPGLSNIKAAAGGTYHSLVLANDGTVRQWGGSDSAPVQVSNLSDVREIASGEAHFIALIGDGTIRVWGRNNQGQFGNGTLSAVDSNMPLQSFIHLRSLPNAVFSLQIAGGISPGMVTDKENDINGDKKVGIAEAVYFLHSASETK